MYLVDEEHIVGLERGEDAGQVAGAVEHRTTGEFETHAQFVGNDVAQCGLAQSWRTVEQGMVEGFATVFGSLHKHLQVLHHALLTTEVAEVEGAQSVLEVFLRW